MKDNSVKNAFRSLLSATHLILTSDLVVLSVAAAGAVAVVAAIGYFAYLLR